MSATMTSAKGLTLEAMRAKAREKYEALGLPHQKLEAWRLIPSKQLKEAFGEAPPVALEDAEAAGVLLPEVTGPRIVLVNGHLDLAHSQLDGAGGVRISTLAALSGEDRAGVLDCWNWCLEKEDDVFGALNLAAFPEAVCVTVAGGAAPEQPLQVVFVAKPTEEHQRALPRVHLYLEDEAALTVTVTRAQVGSAAVLHCPDITVGLGKGARLVVNDWQRTGEGELQLGSLTVRQGRDSFFHQLGVYQGGPLVRHRLRLFQEGEGAETQLDGLTLLQEDNAMHHFIRLTHDAPHGVSRQTYKSVLMDHSRTSFDALVFVQPGAQRIDAHQLNQNLMLSDDARADANPRLEIFNDDVKCAHGATVGRLNEDEVFYLRTRGLSEEQARRLLTFGFAKDLADRITVAPLRRRVFEGVLGQLVPQEGRP